MNMKLIPGPGPHEEGEHERMMQLAREHCHQAGPFEFYREYISRDNPADNCGPPRGSIGTWDASPMAGCSYAEIGHLVCLVCAAKSEE
jgi:hypothetical protein